MVECTFLDYIMGGCQLNFTVSTSLNVSESILLEEHFHWLWHSSCRTDLVMKCALCMVSLDRWPGCSLELLSA